MPQWMAMRASAGTLGQAQAVSAAIAIRANALAQSPGRSIARIRGPSPCRSSGCTVPLPSLALGMDAEQLQQRGHGLLEQRGVQVIGDRGAVAVALDQPGL